MASAKPLASLSLDLDNLWAYLKTHGDPEWQTFPSFLDRAVPRILDFLRARNLRITFFLVGKDAELDSCREPLAAIAAAGHEIGNHSFLHEPWMHVHPRERIEQEIVRAEEVLERATGQRPVGFRGPGHSLSLEILQILLRRGYLYDASPLPTWLMPLARAFYFSRLKLPPEELQLRKAVGGSWRDAFRPLAPYRWRVDGSHLLEIPVTTIPVLRTPFHLSYLHLLGGYSSFAARAYFRTALALCRVTGIAPSFLLHGTDFLSAEDVPEMKFFPGMNQPTARKLERVDWALRHLAKRYDLCPMREHAASAVQRKRVPVLEPVFSGLAVKGGPEREMA
jgi:peptidoglycan/xylan/chitin deacetylase (PgdA/CDA1 family)